VVASRPGKDAEDGRGLQIVEAFSLRWGRRPDADHDGSVTWACLPAPGAEPAQHDRAADLEQPHGAGSLPRPVVTMPVHPEPLPFEGDLVPPSPPPLAPTPYESWEALADGLHVQRLALHLSQLRDRLNTQAAVAGIPAAALIARPADVRTAQALALIDAAGLSAWLDLPAVHGWSDSEPSPLAGINCWADKGYQGAGGTVRLPYRGRWDSLSAGQQAVNRSHAKVRAPAEQAIGTCKSWRVLRKLRCSTTRITSLVQAVLALHLASSD
jgi:hypothetical protein